MDRYCLVHLPYPSSLGLGAFSDDFGYGPDCTDVNRKKIVEPIDRDSLEVVGSSHRIVSAAGDFELVSTGSVNSRTD